MVKVSVGLILVRGMTVVGSVCHGGIVVEVLVGKFEVGEVVSLKVRALGW